MRPLLGPGTAVLKIAALLLAAMFFFPQGGRAHLDELDRSSPPLRISSRLDQVILGEDIDLNDGLDGNAELLLEITLNATGNTSGYKPHTDMVRNYSDPDFLYFDRSLMNKWVINQQIDAYTECYPRTPVTLGAKLTEVDTTGLDNVLHSLASTAVGSFLGLQIHPSLLGAVVGGAAGLLYALPSDLNGNDELGFVSGAVPESGTASFDMRAGSRKTAAIQVTAENEPLLGDDRCCACSGKSKKTASKPDDEIKISFQNPYSLIAAIEIEEGNPSLLMSEHLEGIKTTLERTTVGLSRALAGAAIADAINREGVDQAIDYFDAADRLARDEASTSEAIGWYDKASETALKSMNAKTVKKRKRPLQLHLAPDYFSTEACRSPEILAVAPGARGPVKIAVSGLPEDVSYELRKPDPARPVFLIKFFIGNPAPGEYAITIAAEDKKSAAIEKAFTLSITTPRRDSPTCMPAVPTLKPPQNFEIISVQ